MKPPILSIASMVLAAATVAVGCPALQPATVPCESSYDCPTGFGCDNEKQCASGLAESVLTVVPNQVDVAVFGSTTFSANIDGRPVGVDWALDSSSVGTGTISNTGTFFAPATIPDRDVATIWARLKRHPELRTSATVRIVAAGSTDGGLAGGGRTDSGATDGGSDAKLGPNLVPDPGFETSYAGWSHWMDGTLALSSTNPHGGTQCLCLSARTDQWQGPVFDLTSRVKASHTYRVVFWARPGDSSTTNLDVSTKLVCDGASSTPQYTSVASKSSSGEWVELSGDSLVPDCAISSLEIYAQGPEQGVDLCIDDVSIQERLE